MFYKYLLILFFSVSCSCNAYMVTKHSELEKEHYNSLKNYNLRSIKNYTSEDDDQYQTFSKSDIRHIRYTILICGIMIFIVLCFFFKCILC